MMMLYRLVRLIETHSQALAGCLLDQVQSSALTPCFRKHVPPKNSKSGCTRSTIIWGSGS